MVLECLLQSSQMVWKLKKRRIVWCMPPICVLFIVFFFLPHTPSFLLSSPLVFDELSLAKSNQFSLVAQSCLTLCDPKNRSMPGLPVHHQLPESTQTHVHWVGDAIQPSHPLSSPSPPILNLSQHQGFFQWVSSSHQVAKGLEFQLQYCPIVGN